MVREQMERFMAEVAPAFDRWPWALNGGRGADSVSAGKYRNLTPGLEPGSGETGKRAWRFGISAGCCLYGRLAAERPIQGIRCERSGRK